MKNEKILEPTTTSEQPKSFGDLARQNPELRQAINDFKEKVFAAIEKEKSELHQITVK